MKLLFAAPVAAIIMMAPAVAQQGVQQSAWGAYSKATFDRAISAGQPVVVHVHADWCPTCRRQQPILQKLSSDGALAGVVTLTASFDNDKAFNQANRVTSQSTIIVFKGGKEVARAAGATDAKVIGDLVAKAK
jgi:thiol-disulfide isomerase/thioredoxin